MFVHHNATTEKIVRCSSIITTLLRRLLDVRASQRHYRKRCQMFVYHNALQEVCQMFVHHYATTGKVVRCSCIITPLQRRLLDVRASQRHYRKCCQMFVLHNALIGKVVRCSYILTPLLERLLDVRASQRHCRNGWQMFVFHNATIGKVVRCSCIIPHLHKEGC